MMKFTVDQLSAMIHCRIEGDGSAILTHFAPIEEAAEGALSFIASSKYSHYIHTTKATALLVNNDFQSIGANMPVLIRVDDVYSTLSELMNIFTPANEWKSGVEQPCFISPTANIAEDAYFGAFSYAGNQVKVGKCAQIYPQVFLGDGVEIGEYTIIHAGVKIYAGCKIGHHCIIHSGAIIGSDGFGFAPQPDGSYKKIPQNGIVIIKDDVEIGANTTIDRAVIKATILGNGVKLDNLIQIAHNVEIGQNTAIASQAGISGSARIGENCRIGGQVGIVGHISIADGSQIGAQSGVAKPIEEKDKKWFGSPAIPLFEAIRAQSAFRNLPDIIQRINRLEQSHK